MTLNRAVRRTASMAAIAALASGGLVAGAGTAHAAGIADLTGVVVDAAGTPLSDVEVDAFTTPSDGSTPVYVDDAYTDSNGRYSFDDLEPGALSSRVNPAVKSETEFKLFFSSGAASSAAAAAHTPGYLDRGLGGSKSIAKAGSVAVPAGGTATAPTQVLPQAAGVLVRVISPSGAPLSEVRDASGAYLGGNASAYVYEADAADPTSAYASQATDTDDNSFYTGATPALPVPTDGLIYVRGLEPGQPYVVSGGGASYNPATGSTVSFESRFAGGDGSYADASSVTPAAGQFAPVEVRLTAALAPLERPRIVGNSSFGSTLKADPGTWASQPNTEFSYQWTRGGVAVTGATGTTYEVTKADKKDKIGLVVTAARGTLIGSAAAEPTSKVGEKSKVKAKRDGDAFDVTVKVAKKGKAKKVGKIKGKVVLLTEEGEVASRKAKLKSGKVNDLAPKFAYRGEKKLVVQYLGGGKLGSDTGAAKLKGGNGKSKGAKGKGGSKGKKN